MHRREMLEQAVKGESTCSIQRQREISSRGNLPKKIYDSGTVSHLNQ